MVRRDSSVVEPHGLTLHCQSMTFRAAAIRRHTVTPLLLSLRLPFFTSPFLLPPLSISPASGHRPTQALLVRRSAAAFREPKQQQRQRQRQRQHAQRGDSTKARSDGGVYTGAAGRSNSSAAAFPPGKRRSGRRRNGSRAPHGYLRARPGLLQFARCVAGGALRPGAVCTANTAAARLSPHECQRAHAARRANARSAQPPPAPAPPPHNSRAWVLQLQPYRVLATTGSSDDLGGRTRCRRTAWRSRSAPCATAATTPCYLPCSRDGWSSTSPCGQESRRADEGPCPGRRTRRGGRERRAGRERGRRAHLLRSEVRPIHRTALAPPASSSSSSEGSTAAVERMASPELMWATILNSMGQTANLWEPRLPHVKCLPARVNVFGKIESRGKVSPPTPPCRSCQCGMIICAGRPRGMPGSRDLGR